MFVFPKFLGTDIDIDLKSRYFSLQVLVVNVDVPFCVCASTFHLTSILKCTKPLTFFIHLTFSLFYKSTS